MPFQLEKQEKPHISSEVFVIPYQTSYPVVVRWCVGVFVALVARWSWGNCAVSDREPQTTLQNVSPLVRMDAMERACIDGWTDSQAQDSAYVVGQGRIGASTACYCVRLLGMVLLDYAA